MVLVPETMLIELKGKLPKSPEFQSTLGLGYDLDKIQTLKSRGKSCSLCSSIILLQKISGPSS